MTRLNKSILTVFFTMTLFIGCTKSTPHQSEVASSGFGDSSLSGKNLENLKSLEGSCTLSGVACHYEFSNIEYITAEGTLVDGFNPELVSYRIASKFGQFVDKDSLNNVLLTFKLRNKSNEKYYFNMLDNGSAIGLPHVYYNPKANPPEVLFFEDESYKKLTKEASEDLNDNKVLFFYYLGEKNIHSNVIIDTSNKRRTSLNKVQQNFILDTYLNHSMSGESAYANYSLNQSSTPKTFECNLESGNIKTCPLAVTLNDNKSPQDYGIPSNFKAGGHFVLKVKKVIESSNPSIHNAELEQTFIIGNKNQNKSSLDKAVYLTGQEFTSFFKKYSLDVKEDEEGL